MRKTIKTALATLFFAAITASTAFAGTWKQDARGWWYNFSDEAFAQNEWVWIDSNNDGIAECYGFDGSGYLYQDTVTPDGFRVDSNGAWTENGTVQTAYVMVPEEGYGFVDEPVNANDPAGAYLLKNGQAGPEDKGDETDFGYLSLFPNGKGAVLLDEWLKELPCEWSVTDNSVTVKTGSGSVYTGILYPELNQIQFEANGHIYRFSKL